MIDHQEVFQSLLESKTQLNLGAQNVPVSFQTAMVKYEEDVLFIHNSIPLRYLKDVLQKTFFTVSAGSVVIKSSKLEPSGCFIKIKAEHIENWAQQRSGERHSFTDSEKVWCLFRNPFDEKTQLKKKVIDLSGGGLSLKLYRQTKVFLKDQIISDLRLSNWDESQPSKHARVVYLKSVINIKGEEFFQAGLQFLDS
jgi:hypothetical protein